MEEKNTVQHGVMAYFDEKTNRFINGIIDEIAAATGNTFMIDNRLPPHMTIGIMESENLNGETDRLKSYLQELRRKKVDVAFRSIGIFPPTTLYLGPILDSDLIELNQAIARLIERAGGRADAHYTFNTWQPHATVAMSLTDEQLEKALHRIEDIKLDFVGKIEKLALTQCCPLQELAVYNLK